VNYPTEQSHEKFGENNIYEDGEEVTEISSALCFDCDFRAKVFALT
jgi:hypothetical protein